MLTSKLNTSITATTGFTLWDYLPDIWNFNFQGKIQIELLTTCVLLSLSSSFALWEEQKIEKFPFNDIIPIQMSIIEFSHFLS